MTKEQEEAIETMKSWIDFEKHNRNKINKADELIKIQETVLNILKEKDKEIENAYWKGYIQRQNEAAEICKICKYRKKYKDLEQKKSISEQFSKELDIKDKQIDLMAEYIASLDIEEDICVKTGKDLNECDRMAFGECENCIKQYFKNKAEKE